MKKSCFKNQDYLDRFKESKRAENIKENSLNLYSFTFKHFLLYLDSKDIKILDVEISDIKGFILDYSNKNKISDRTKDNMRRHLSSLYEWLFENDFITKNPMLKYKKIDYEFKIKDILTQEDKVLLEGCSLNTRERAIVELLLCTGLRVNELCNLKIENLNLDKKELLVYGKRNKWRKLNISEKAKYYLKKYIRDRSFGYIFLNKIKTDNLYNNMKTQSVQNLIKNICEKSNIKKKVTVHTFRRIFCNDLRKVESVLNFVLNLWGILTQKQQ